MDNPPKGITRKKKKKRAAHEHVGMKRGQKVINEERARVGGDDAAMLPLCLVLGGDDVSVSLEKAARCLTLRHAMTIHKSQSRTLQGHVRICPGRGPGHVAPHFTINHLLVAASRATSIANLSME